MAIFVDADTKVLVQGLTGGQGRFHGLRNRDYGTQGRRRRHARQGRPGRRRHPRVRLRRRGRRRHGRDGLVRRRAAEGRAGGDRRGGRGRHRLRRVHHRGHPRPGRGAHVYNLLVRDFPGTRLLGPNCPGRDQPGQVQHRHHADRHRPAAERRSAQRRHRQPLRHAHLPGAVRAQAQRHRRVVVRRHRRRPGAGDELRRLPRRVREGSRDARHDPVRRDRRLGRGGGRRVHPRPACPSR